MKRLRSNMSERGTALVEAAIVLPILALLTFGAIDGGLYFHTYLTVGNAARDGARAIANSGANGSADFDGLQAINDTLSTMNPSNVQRVIVFKADTTSSTAKPGCLAGVASEAEACNVYSPANGDFELGSSAWDGEAFGGAQGWPANTRDDHRNSDENGADLIGVTIQATADTPLGVFGGQQSNVTRTVVVRIEARKQ